MAKRFESLFDCWPKDLKNFQNLRRAMHVRNETLQSASILVRWRAGGNSGEPYGGCVRFCRDRPGR